MKHNINLGFQNIFDGGVFMNKEVIYPCEVWLISFLMFNSSNCVTSFKVLGSPKPVTPGYNYCFYQTEFYAISFRILICKYFCKIANRLEPRSVICGAWSWLQLVCLKHNIFFNFQIFLQIHCIFNWSYRYVFKDSC